jgi:hypothetical protein
MGRRETAGAIRAGRGDPSWPIRSAAGRRTEDRSDPGWPIRSAAGRLDPVSRPIQAEQEVADPVGGSRRWRAHGEGLRATDESSWRSHAGAEVVCLARLIVSKMESREAVVWPRRSLTEEDYGG